MLTNKTWIALLMAVVLAACGSDFENGDDNGNGGGTTDGGDGPLDLAVGNGSGSSFQQGILSLGLTELAANGTTGVEVTVVNRLNNNALYVGGSVDVEFSSSCSLRANPLAVFSPATRTGRGTITTSYTAEGCSGEDLITASVSRDGAIVGTASATVTIESELVGYIQSGVPTPSIIAIKELGTESLPSISRVPFTVRDRSGNPVEGQEVTFSIDTAVAGVELIRTSAVTNSEGRVNAIVQSGTVHTGFRVRAETEVLDPFGNATGNFIRTESLPIAVNTGLPSADRFSMSVETFNPLSWNVDGTEVGITLIASDIYGGPVANGTVITFVSNAGQVIGANGETESCIIASGQCSVTWRSSNPRPADGGIQILAYTKGDEYFVDEDGDGAFDGSETYFSLPEPYLDADNSGNYTLGNFFVDANNNGIRDGVAVDQPYRGAVCTQEARDDGHCAELAYLSDNVRMIMASETATINGVPAGPVDISGGPAVFTVEFLDVNGNVPAAGTPFEVVCRGDNPEVDIWPDLGAIPNVYSLGDGFSVTVSIFRADDPGSAQCYVQSGLVRESIDVTW